MDARNFGHLHNASTSNLSNQPQGKKIWYKNIPRASILRMIELIKEREVLYDPSHPNYNANHHRNIIYKKISEQLIAEEHFDNQGQMIEVQDVWLSLRRKFARENTRPLTPDGSVPQPDFEYYDALKFLGEYPAKEKPESASKKPPTVRKRPKPTENYASPEAFTNGDVDFYENFRFSMESQANGTSWMENFKEHNLPKWEDLDGGDEETPSMEATSESSNAYLNSLVQRATENQPTQVANAPKQQTPKQQSQIVTIESTSTTSEATSNLTAVDETTKALGQNVMEIYANLKNDGCLRQAADFRKKIHDLIYEYDVYLAEKRAHS